MNTGNSIETIFEDIIGQFTATEFLSAVIKQRRIAPAYLFTGPKGVGKKITALRFLEGLINDHCKKKNLTLKNFN